MFLSHKYRQNRHASVAYESTELPSFCRIRIEGTSKLLLHKYRQNHYAKPANIGVCTVCTCSGLRAALLGISIKRDLLQRCIITTHTNSPNVRELPGKNASPFWTAYFGNICPTNMLFCSSCGVHVSLSEKKIDIWYCTDGVFVIYTLCQGDGCRVRLKKKKKKIYIATLLTVAYQFITLV